MAREMGTPCPSKEEETNPSVFINLTSLPKTSGEEDINTESKCDLQAQSSLNQVDYMDNNLTNIRKFNGTHLPSDNEVNLLKALVDKTENTTTLHDDADNIQNADHDDNGITHSLLLSKGFINMKFSSPNNHNYLNGNNDDKVNKEALEPMSSLQTQDSYNVFDKNNFLTDVSQALVDVREISGISDTNNLRKQEMNTK